MKTTILTCFPALILFVGPMVGQAQTRTQAADGPMLEVGDPGGFTIEAAFRSDSRAIDFGGSAPEVDVTYLLAEVGYQFLPFFYAGVQTGWVTAEDDLDDRDGTAAYGLTLKAYLAEFPISKSPVVGNTQTLGFGIDAEYLAWQADSPGAGELDWSETTAMAYVRYAMNRAGEINLEPFDLTGTSVYLGLAWSGIDADSNGRSGNEDESTGLVLGADLRLARDVATHLKGTLYGSDSSFRIGFAYHF